MPLRVEIRAVIDGEILINLLWGIYNEAFSSLNLVSPCRQSLNFQEFLRALCDPEIIKAVLFENDGDGSPEGISLGTYDLSKVSWISLEFFRQRFPVEFQERQIYYFLGTATTPGARKKRGGMFLLAQLKELLPTKPVIVVYDYADDAEKGMARLGRIICGGGEPEILGKQTYCAGRVAQ